ncbi:MAG: hypothetical protein RL754_138 [Bacteroidota bacterium]|jgi:AcrR family transcriptional regulator
MNAQQIAISPKLFVKNPEETELGQRILSASIELMDELGYEGLTFKKIGAKMESPEASVYRYFQNKHQLLAYLINWYWGWLELKMAEEFLLLNCPKEKLEKAIDLLVLPMDEDPSIPHINEKKLQQIVVAEYPKIYLTKAVEQENKEGYFLGYKHICDTMSKLALQVNPDYAYPHSLFATIVEAAQSQQFFMKHLPRLTDIENNRTVVSTFLKELMFKTISA